MRKLLSAGFIISLLVFVFQIHVFAGNIKWAKNPDIGINNFNSVACNGVDLLVSVGEDGTIKTSADAVTWVGRKSGTIENLYSVVWGNGSFVVVGEGVALSSSNGVDWSIVTTPSLRSIAFNGTQYVAVGKFGTIVTSADAQMWTEISLGISETLNDIFWTGQQFMAIGENGGVYISQDGTAWSKGSVGFNISLKTISWNGSRYVIIAGNGSVLTSIDGINWTWTLNGKEKSVASDKVQPAGSQGVMRIGDNIEEIIHDGKQFVAVGAKGLITVSNDGVKWVQKNPGVNTWLKNIIFTGTQYVVVGSYGTMLTSTDLNKWTRRTSGKYVSFFNPMTSEYNGEAGNFESVAYGNNRFVTVGNAGIILTSIDGEYWTTASSNTDVDLHKIIWNGKKFVAVGSKGTILTSVDGKKWVRANSGVFNWLNNVTWNGKMFVVVGMGGTILTSSDGVKWTNIQSGTGNSINRIVWDNGSFIAIEAKNEAVLISRDGVKWIRSAYVKDGLMNGDGNNIVIMPEAENLKNKISKIDNLDHIIWNGTEYVGVGSLTMSQVAPTKGDTTVTGRVGNSTMTSVDGLNWRMEDLGTSNNLYSIAWSGESLVAVGANGTILTSIPSYIKVIIDGKNLEVDMPPIIRNGRTLVPLRAVFEALGASITWDDATRTVTGVKGDTVVTLKIDSKDAMVNDKSVALDVPATIVKSRTLVPVRFIAESLGAEVSWDQVTKTVSVKSLE